ncbi:MAG: hypothetical protein AB7V22_12340 [Kiritimatiellia bacterium]
MERAEFAAGSIEVRGSRPVHRLLNFLGAFFLGIGPDARAERSAANWWDREPTPERDESAPRALGRQAELFDAAGQAVAVPAARPAAAKSAPAQPRTVVSVQAKSRTGARVVATTRAVAATRVAAVPKTAANARGEVGRHLVMSQSLSSGREVSRWFSVPQRTLLPRFQLFEGADAVVEEQGRLRIGSPALKTQRGRVWFV